MLAVAVKGKGVVLLYSGDIIEDYGGGVWCVPVQLWTEN